MHAVELMELAALIATHAKTVVHDADRVSLRGVEQYWISSKCRLERWSRALKSHSDDLQAPTGHGRLERWLAARGVLEEILASEVLTRVWTAVATAHDRLRGANDIEPIARSALVGHLEARNRVLRLMLLGQRCDIESAAILNQFRGRCERWTDMLLGCLWNEADLADLAFDSTRAANFSSGLHSAGQQRHEPPAQQRMLAGMRAGLQARPMVASPNADLNEQIAASLLSCLRAELFESTGLLKSLWLMRLSTTANDAQALLAELLACHNRECITPNNIPPSRLDHF